jgi:hypothetical protein
MKGTWREGSLAGDPEGYVEKALGTGIFFHRGPTLGNLGEGSSTGDFKRWMKGALWMESLSLKRPRGGGLGGAPSLGTLEDTFGKSPDAGISLCGGPFVAKGNPAWGGLYAGDYDG